MTLQSRSSPFPPPRPDLAARPPLALLPLSEREQACSSLRQFQIDCAGGRPFSKSPPPFSLFLLSSLQNMPPPPPEESPPGCEDAMDYSSTLVFVSMGNILEGIKATRLQSLISSLGIWTGLTAERFATCRDLQLEKGVLLKWGAEFGRTLRICMVAGWWDLSSKSEEPSPPSTLGKYPSPCFSWICVNGWKGCTAAENPKSHRNRGWRHDELGGDGGRCSLRGALRRRLWSG
ncbi:unnamed protein product [Linum trigynum]|uniref:Uncharacterized protein n=1 Tax=Linum trigynum TaxID=586398 RepID=A0AAV2G4B1_9ROSI